VEEMPYRPTSVDVARRTVCTDVVAVNIDGGR
jgi:hypothetical protein